MTAPDKSKSGWKLFVHPAFSDTFDALVAEVERLRTADRKGYKQHPKTKLLKRIVSTHCFGSAGHPIVGMLSSWNLLA